VLKGERFMRRFNWIIIASLALGGLPLVIGCDETVSSRETTEVKDDGTKVTEKKETTHNDATDTTKTTEEKKVDRPDDKPGDGR
jgi:hypothetical protein